MALVAHLCRHAVLPGHERHPPRFLNGVRERLLHVDVLAHFHRHDGGRRMDVVRRRDGERVNLGHVLEHVPVIPVPLGVRKFLERILAPVPVRVAQRDNVFGLARHDVRKSFAAGADGGHIELLVG